MTASSSSDGMNPPRLVDCGDLEAETNLPPAARNSKGMVMPLVALV